MVSYKWHELLIAICGASLIMLCSVKAQSDSGLASAQPSHSQDCYFRTFVARVDKVLDTNTLRVTLSTEAFHLIEDEGLKTIGQHDERVGKRDIRVAGIAACSKSNCIEVRAQITKFLSGRRLRILVPVSTRSEKATGPIGAIVEDEAGAAIKTYLVQHGWATVQAEDGCLAITPQSARGDDAG